MFSIDCKLFTMNLKDILKTHFVFILTYIFILIVCIIFLILYTKVEIHWFLNRYNSPFWDVFFKYITEFGAFVLIAPIIIYLAFIRFRYAIIATASTLLSTLITQILKRVVWYDSPRPKVVFKDLNDLHLVENVHLHSNHSFPSGHTTGAFALFVVLALIHKRPFYQLTFLMTAILVGYSRIYLSQHFLIDVVVGSMVGTFSAFFCYLWFNNSISGKKTFMDKSILSFRKSGKH